MRRILGLYFFVPVSLSLLVACGGGNPTPTATPTAAISPTPDSLIGASVAVDPQSATLTSGQTRQLAATFADENGTVLSGPTVTWSTSSPLIATVSAAGLVTGVTPGSATIIATSGEVSGTVLITVTDTPVASVVVSPQSATLATGGTQQLVTSLQDASGEVLTGHTVIWTSSAQSIATVSATGLVTGIANGSAFVTATVEGKTGTMLITVTDIPVASITVIPQSATLTTGGARQLLPTLKDANGNVLTGLSVIWSSSIPSVATVSATGLVTGIANGSAVITATAEGKAGTSVITVTNLPVASMAVSPQSATLATGGTQQLVATLKDANGNVLTGSTVTWSSASPSIAAVSATGLVTGIANGTAVVTATAEGKVGTVFITVTDLPVAAITVSPPLVVLIAGTFRQLVATLEDANGGAVTGSTVTWSSSSPSVATVSSTGLVTSIVAGSATITATAEGISGTTSIEVVQPP